MSILVREVTPEDSSCYYELRVQSEQEFPQFVGFNAERELTVGASGIKDLIAGYTSEGTIIWGAFNDQTLLGVVVLSRRLSPKYRHKAFLWGMYVVPELRGEGVAESLMQAAINWAVNNPEVLAISLQVTLSNLRGQSFYKRYGFEVFGTEEQALFAAGEFHGVHYMELSTNAT